MLTDANQSALQRPYFPAIWQDTVSVNYPHRETQSYAKNVIPPNRMSMTTRGISGPIPAAPQCHTSLFLFGFHHCANTIFTDFVDTLVVKL